MLENYSKGVREVLQLAQEEARELVHSHIGTEHLLLALTHDARGTAVVLEDLGVSTSTLRKYMQSKLGADEKPPPTYIPFTPRAKRSLEFALREALSYGSIQIETNHLLLGLTRDSESTATDLLQHFDISADTLRSTVVGRDEHEKKSPDADLELETSIEASRQVSDELINVIARLETVQEIAQEMECWQSKAEALAEAVQRHQREAGKHTSAVDQNLYDRLGEVLKW